MDPDRSIAVGTSLRKFFAHYQAWRESAAAGTAQSKRRRGAAHSSSLALSRQPGGRSVVRRLGSVLRDLGGRLGSGFLPASVCNEQRQEQDPTRNKERDEPEGDSS